MTDDKQPLSEQEIKERRAAALKRVQEMNQRANAGFAGKAGKNPKPPPPKGRPFRHQGR